jgi:GlpG protein
MSGVIYALIGYCWLYQRLCPGFSFSLPPGLLVVAIIWLLLCLSGVVTLVGLGNIGGLAAGLVMAGLLAWLDQRWPTSPGLP